MKLEIFTFCESGADYSGRLCIMGAYDTISPKTLPALIPHCAVVARLRLARIEEGKHKITVMIADDDGKLVMPRIDADVTISFAGALETSAINAVINVNQLKLAKYGEYTIDLAVDGVQLGSLPLYCNAPPAQK